MAKMTKGRCIGCRNNFYNGNNDIGVKECWSYKDAVLVKKQEVPVSQAPPYNQPELFYPNCYRRPGYAYLEKVKS